jgi:hypothetical protein
MRLRSSVPISGRAGFARVSVGVANLERGAEGSV